jgi:hypothetical protein
MESCNYVRQNVRKQEVFMKKVDLMAKVANGRTESGTQGRTKVACNVVGESQGDVRSVIHPEPLTERLPDGSDVSYIYKVVVECDLSLRSHSQKIYKKNIRRPGI